MEGNVTEWSDGVDHGRGRDGTKSGNHVFKGEELKRKKLHSLSLPSPPHKAYI